MDRKTLLKLAAESELDVRTVKKALENGVASLRGNADQERLRRAAKKLGVSLH